MMETLNNFASIPCFITFVLGAVFMLAMIIIAAMGKVEEPTNKVRFYVTKDFLEEILCIYGQANQLNMKKSGLQLLKVLSALVQNYVFLDLILTPKILPT